MGDHRSYRQRRYAFGKQLFDLRTRTSLTQSQLADLLGVHWHSVQKWESGESYPKAETLQRLVAVCLQHHAFVDGSEREGAIALWQQVSEDGRARLPSFDEAWFADALERAQPSAAVSSPPGADPLGERVRDASPDGASSGIPTRKTPRTIVDLGEGIASPDLVGREQDLSTLLQWVIADRCRVVAVTGMGGIGKSSLALTFAQQALDSFDIVLFRSLQNGPPLASVLDHAITTISDQQAIPPEQVTDKIALLVTLLRERRSLVILDNFESIMQPGEFTGTYRESHADYGMLVQALSEREHRSCLLLTSREKPSELAQWESPSTPVRALRLGGLNDEACCQILARREIVASAQEMEALQRLYDGNPLAFNLVAGPIRDLFGGEVATFLSAGYGYFDGVHKLMAQHFARLTPLERTIVYWFALQREPMSLEMLANRLRATVPPRDILGAVESLVRRGQVERGANTPTFALQPMILEFATDQIIEMLCQEVLTARPRLLESHAIIQATAKDYVRRRQEQLVVDELLARLIAMCRTTERFEGILIALLDAWRGQASESYGFGPGNVVNLLRLRRGDLRGLDLSRLVLREVYMQGVEMQDARLVDAELQDCVLSEAFGVAHAVTSTPSGSWWAASSINGSIRVTRNGGRTLSHSILAHKEAVMALRFSPDEKLLATGSWDCTVKLWDLQSGAHIATLTGHTDHVYCLAFSPDSRRIVSGSADHTVRIWEIATVLCLKTIHPHEGTVRGVDWSPDGCTIASCGDGVRGDGIRGDGYSGDSNSGDGSAVHLWDAESGEAVKTLEGHLGTVTKAAFSPDGALIASGGDDCAIRVWKVASGAPVQVYVEHRSTVSDVVWSPDGRSLASASFDGTIRLWALEHTSSRHVLLGHGTTVNTIAFSHAGALLLSCSGDQSFRVWDVATGRCIRVLRVYGRFFFSVVWSPDGQSLLSANSDATLTVWDVSDGSARMTMGTRALASTQGVHAYAVYAAAWSPDGRWLASGGFDRNIHLWDATTGAVVHTIEAHDDIVYHLAWSSDGKWLASSGRDQTVRLWDGSTGVCRWIARGHSGPINGIAWSPDGEQLASCSEDHCVRLWRATDGAPLHTLAQHRSAVASVAWNPDGRHLATAGGGGTRGEVLIWDAASGALLRSFTGLSGGILHIVWSADGRQLIGGDSAGAIHWWDAASGAEMHSCQSHLGWVRSLEASPDGATLLSSGEDGVIHLWDVARAKLIKKVQIDRPYEGMQISGLSGITDAQRAALIALGAVEH